MASSFLMLAIRIAGAKHASEATDAIDARKNRSILLHQFTYNLVIIGRCKSSPWIFA